MRTKGSIRSAAGKEHRCPAPWQDPGACSETDTQSTSGRRSNLGIRSHSGLASSPQTDRSGSRYGTVQTQSPEMLVTEAAQMESRASGGLWRKKSNLG